MEPKQRYSDDFCQNPAVGGFLSSRVRLAPFSNICIWRNTMADTEERHRFQGTKTTSVFPLSLDAANTYKNSNPGLFISKEKMTDFLVDTMRHPVLG